MVPMRWCPSRNPNPNSVSERKQFQLAKPHSLVFQESLVTGKRRKAQTSQCLPLRRMTGQPTQANGGHPHATDHGLSPILGEWKVLQCTGILMWQLPTQTNLTFVAELTSCQLVSTHLQVLVSCFKITISLTHTCPARDADRKAPTCMPCMHCSMVDAPFDYFSC